MWLWITVLAAPHAFLPGFFVYDVVIFSDIERDCDHVCFKRYTGIAFLSQPVIFIVLLDDFEQTLSRDKTIVTANDKGKTAFAIVF